MRRRRRRLQHPPHTSSPLRIGVSELELPELDDELDDRDDEELEEPEEDEDEELDEDELDDEDADDEDDDDDDDDDEDVPLDDELNPPDPVVGAFGESSQAVVNAATNVPWESSSRKSRRARSARSRSS